MPPRTADENDGSDDRESGDEADDELESDDDELDDESDDDEEAAAETVPEEAPRPSWRERMRRRARGAGGMGRRSSGPAPRPSSPPLAGAGVSGAAAVEADSELAPDVSTWPGTADAARMAGKHVSTIKLWRAQGRIRAIQDAAGCWRHHPDDLAESVDAPDQTDPGAVLAQGMTAIVQQGSDANQRLIAMTELATEGLQTATGVLSEELKRAYSKIAELEEKLADSTAKLAATRELDLKHERYMRRLDQKHEMELAGSKETSARLDGLLTIIGPIAASIAARLIGNLAAAEKAEARAVGMPMAQAPEGAPPSASSSPAAPPSVSPLTATDPKDDRLVPIETRITDAMTRLCVAVRNLDGPAFQGLRAMMPVHVQNALDDIMDGKTDSAVGQALATLIKAAQGLSDLQFQALRPITPADIASVLGELRELIRVKEEPS